MKGELKRIAKKLKSEVLYYKALLSDSRTPLIAKLFLGMAIGYFLLPFDLIPDFIPVLGHLDDAILVPFFIYIGLKLIPKELKKEIRARYS